MARAKKDKLSLEELLEQAIVKEGDQPYAVPSNWVWTQLKNLSRCISKGTTPKGGKDAYKDKGVAFLRVENINNIGKIDLENIKFIDEEIHLGFLKRSILEQDDILVSIAGTLGRTAIVDKAVLPLNTNQAIAFIRLQNKEKISSKYIEKLISSPAIQEKLLGQTKVTSIPNLTLEIISNCPIPLPPLAEQQRIVERIESLFEKLDTAKELAQNALDSFENRKAAILHKAFTGELTAKWREENGVSLDSWEDTAFGKYADTKYGYTESANVEKVGPKFLRITDIQDGRVNWDSVPYCPISENEFEKYRLTINDIVVARTGATTGKSYIILEEVNAVFASYLIRISITNKDRLLPKYLWGFMQSTLYWNQIMEVKKGIAQPGVNANKLKELVIQLPSIKEQYEILKIIENILDNEQHAQELCEVIEKIDLMKKAILARAFRGELGTNNPEEESAIELLKEVLKEKL